MNCYLGDKIRSYSLSQNICGALLNIMKTTNYIAMAPLQYFFIRKNGDDEDEQCDYKIRY